MYFLDIVDSVIKEHKLKDAPLVRRTIKAFLNAVLEEMSKGNSVVIRDFGEFTLKEYKSRKYPNPKGGWVEKETRLFPKFNFARSARLRIAKNQSEDKDNA